MVMIMKQGWNFHRENAKGRRACAIKAKKIPMSPRGRICVVPRPGPVILKKVKSKKA